MLISRKLRIGGPIDELVPLGEIPAFVGCQGRNLHLIQSLCTTGPAAQVALKLSGEVFFRRYIALSKALFFVQSGKVSMITITKGATGLLHFGSCHVYKVGDQLQGACDIAITAEQGQGPLRIIAAYDDGTLERIVLNDSNYILRTHRSSTDAEG